MRTGRVVSALAATVLVSLPSAAAVTAPPPVLGIVLDGGQGHLARLDPGTLRPLARSSFLTNGFAVAPALSPVGSTVALGSTSFMGIRLVDVRTLREVGEVSLGLAGGNVVATSWPTRRTLLVAGVRMGTLVLATIDPSTRKVVRVQSIRGLPVKAGRTRDGLAVLIAPPNGIGAARLAIARRDRVRLVTLPVRAGRRLSEQPRTAIASQSIPALAIDDAGGRAYVFDSSGGVVDVNLATGRVRSHQLRERTVAKVLSGPNRSARWLGGGLVAVTGSDDRVHMNGAEVESRPEPAGLAIVDVRNWTTHMVDRDATTVVLGGGILFTSAGAATVRAYDSTGVLRFELDGLRSSWVQIAGDHAYVDGRIVDLPSGQIVGQLPTESRVVVLPTDGSQFPL